MCDHTLLLPKAHLGNLLVFFTDCCRPKNQQVWGGDPGRARGEEKRRGREETATASLQRPGGLIQQRHQGHACRTSNKGLTPHQDPIGIETQTRLELSEHLHASSKTFILYKIKSKKLIWLPGGPTIKVCEREMKATFQNKKLLNVIFLHFLRADIF